MANINAAVILGHQWNNELDEIKDRYRDIAKAIKKQHEEKYPGYQYQPRKPSEKQRRASRPRGQKAVAFFQGHRINHEPVSTAQDLGQPTIGNAHTTATPSTVTEASPTDNVPDLVDDDANGDPIETGSVADPVEGVPAVGAPNNAIVTSTGQVVFFNPAGHTSAVQDLVHPSTDQAPVENTRHLINELLGEKEQGWYSLGQEYYAAAIPGESEEPDVLDVLEQYNDHLWAAEATNTVTNSIPQAMGLRFEPSAEVQRDTDYTMSLVDWDQVDAEVTEAANRAAAELKLHQLFAKY
jgi:hypothetical protein